MSAGKLPNVGQKRNAAIDSCKYVFTLLFLSAEIEKKKQSHPLIKIGPK